eukprot:5659377-Alexandrium_andersonii.AAC.1
MLLGPNTELLARIPQKGSDLRPEGQGPLMLPTTLRRLVKSVTASAIGPLVEPALSAWQAARRGGSCRQNIQLA